MYDIGDMFLSQEQISVFVPDIRTIRFVPGTNLTGPT